MRLGSFKRNLKKEFKENYEDNKRKKNRSIWIKLIPVYCVLGLIFIFGLFLGLDAIATNSYNSKYDDRISLYENVSYRKLDTITREEFKEYASFAPRTSIFDQLKNIQMGGFGFSKADASMVEDEKYYETSPGLSETQTDTYYETNNQEEGIVEADIAKFDGTYCYYITHNRFCIYRLDGTLVASRPINNNYGYYMPQPYKLQLYKNRIIILNDSVLEIYTFEDENLKLEKTIQYYSGIETRLTDKYLYVGGCNGYSSSDEVPENLYYDMLSRCGYIYSIEKIDLDTLDEKAVDLASGYGVTMYMSDTHFVISNSSYITTPGKSMTLNSVFDLDLEPVGVFVSFGTILDQYSIDVYDNTLRVVSTGNSGNGVLNVLTIFDLKKKCVLSTLDSGIGLPGERVKSATFTDNKCYIVTFLQTDPLYEIDITDPKNPTIKNALKVEGYSSYLKTFNLYGEEYVFGAGIDNGYKYAIYKNDENLTQIGKDYLLIEQYEEYRNGRNYVAYRYADWMSINPHAMFFYQKGDIIYFGAPFSENYYILYKIDVKAEEPIVKHLTIETKTETRVFLYEGKLYLPQEDKLIIEDFVE